MTESVSLNLPADPDAQPKSAQAFGFALLLEVVIIAGIVLILANSSPTQAAHDEPVPLTLVDDPEPKKEEPKPEPLPKPQPVKLVSKVVPKTATPPQPQIVEPTPPLAAVESDVQTAFASPAPTPSAPPVPVPTTGKVDKAQEYAGKVHDAVQSAYFYPPVAAAMHFSGRVRVEFVLKDAHVAESHILQSCGIGIFDRAALEAVQKAHYPEPPENLRGQDLHYQIWVELSTR